ncbi:hypothetical protein D3C80_2085900 [compost metagenome]
MQDHVARLAERFQRHDRRHQFHAVVGGVGLAAGDLALAPAKAQQRGPAAGTGIAQAGTVGVDLDLLACVGGACF